MFSLLNLLAYIKTEEVFAVPEPPTKSTALLFVEDFGYFMMKFNNNSALKESMVGINS